MTDQPNKGKAAESLLWSDEPAVDDLLAFEALAATLVDPLLDPTLDPIALGLSGPWGSGKSTVLGLIKGQLESLTAEDAKILVVWTQPWRYDPTVGAKETLIGEVIRALETEIEALQTPNGEALALVKRLARRVDWAKAVKIAAKASIAFQLPSVDDLVQLVKPKEPEEGDATDRSLDAFRDEFTRLMFSDELQHVRAVVVLVDDLDRCLPRTVVESLEAIRLFLAVPKMSFVIAADERRVADALKAEFPEQAAQEPNELGEEGPAELYLHKIVQTTLPIPALSRFDTQAYILLLQIQLQHDDAGVAEVTGLCADIRKAGGTLDDLATSVAERFSNEMAFSARLTPLLYEKLRGNPRRIKRFLNDLYVRRSVASRRGIELDPAVVAKLMVLEVLFRGEFNIVLDWLAGGTLRDNVAKLEAAAGRPEAPAPAPAPQHTKPAKKVAAKSASARKDAPESATREEPVFSESLLRWAKLPPALAALDLAPYLYLAASFAARPLLDEGLPERLKDLAANMVGSTRRERQAVTDADLQALPSKDVEELAQHFGRLLRDQPSKQNVVVTALLRLARKAAGGATASASALSLLPVSDVGLPTPILLASDDPTEVLAVARSWRDRTTDDRLRAAINQSIGAD
jgi:hypothetical protein